MDEGLNLHWREQTPFTTVKLELPVTHTHTITSMQTDQCQIRAASARGARPGPWRPLPSQLRKGHAPRRALMPLQRPLGVAATAHRAVQSHLANREELLQAGSAHEVGAR